MRAVLQRVRSACVRVDERVVGRIDHGVLAYVGAAPDDSDDDVKYIADKFANLRIFVDEQDKMNRSVRDVGGGILVVSAFTAHADARKGRRPSFDSSASGDVAAPLIDRLVTLLRSDGLTVETGQFGSYMRVESENDGPICVLLDSRRLF